MDDWDWLAPVMLAGKDPVAQAILGGPASDALVEQPFNNSPLGLDTKEAVELTRISQRALAREAAAADEFVDRVA